MATVTKPIALDESLNTTELSSRNVADVLAQELSAVATAIGGITHPDAEDIVYDNSVSGLSATDVQNAIDEIVSDIPTVNDGTLTIQQNGETKGTFTANQSGNSIVNIEIPTTDIQTAVDEFETYNGGLLSECKVALSPNQDLHGYDEPWVGGAGKNKLPLVLADIKSLNTSGTWTGNNYTISGVTLTVLTDSSDNVIGIKTDRTANAQIIFYLGNTPNSGDYILNGCPIGGSHVDGYSIYITGVYVYDIGSGINVSLSGTSYPVAILIRNGTDVSNKTFYPMLRLSTESDPTFEPYENKCPISGHTQVDVDVSDGQTTQEQITVNLGGTYYSGTLDVVSGVFVPDTAKLALNTSTIVSISKSGLTDADIFLLSLPSSYKLSEKAILSHYGYENVQNVNEIGKAWLGTSNTQLRIGFSTYGTTTLEDFKTWLDANNVEGCFELATPTPIQLSPTMVKALVGENHLSAPLDGQEITESKYKQMFTFDDVIAYIQSL